MQTPIFMARSSRSVDEAVEPARVLAHDLSPRALRQMTQLLLDELLGVGPHPVRVREVRAPHDGLRPQLLEQSHADAIALVGGLALAAPVIAGTHRQLEILELVFPLEVHAIEHVRDPADAALADDELEVRVALEHAGEDHA